MFILTNNIPFFNHTSELQAGQSKTCTLCLHSTFLEFVQNEGCTAENAVSRNQ